MRFLDTPLGKVIGIVVVLALVAGVVWLGVVKMAPKTDSPSDVTNLMPPSDPNAPGLIENEKLYGTPPPFPGVGGASRRPEQRR